MSGNNGKRKPGPCRECGAFLFADERDVGICDDCVNVQERMDNGTYFEPGSTEQMLWEISQVPGEFKKIADAAKDELLDMQIDDLDRLMKRGKYLHLRDTIPRQAQ